MLSSLNIEEEISRAQRGITDIAISEEIKEQIIAYTMNGKGDKEQAEIKATIRNLGSIIKNETTGTMYTLTVVATGVEKTDSDNTSKHNSRAYASVTWIDNLGTQNELVSVSGGWNLGPNTLTDRNVNYGVTSGSDNKREHRTPSKNSFSYQGTSDMVGFTLFVDTYAYIKEYNEALTLIVYSSFIS